MSKKQRKAAEIQLEIERAKLERARESTRQIREVLKGLATAALCGGVAKFVPDLLEGLVAVGKASSRDAPHDWRTDGLGGWECATCQVRVLGPRKPEDVYACHGMPAGEA